MNFCKEIKKPPHELARKRELEKKYLQPSSSFAKATVLNGLHELGSHIWREIERRWKKKDSKETVEDESKEAVVKKECGPRDVRGAVWRIRCHKLPYICWSLTAIQSLNSKWRPLKKVKGTVWILEREIGGEEKERRAWIFNGIRQGKREIEYKRESLLRLRDENLVRA